MAADTSAIIDTDTPLFSGLSVAIITSRQLSLENAQDLSKDITTNGGECTIVDTVPARIEGDIRRYTHIISRTSDFPDYNAALDAFIHVIKPAWVEFCMHKRKLTNPRAYNPDPALILSEVTICCGDLPEGDKEAIMGGVIAMGGQYTSALSKLVTHLIALTLDDDKCELALRKGLKCQIVLPHWFDDCLKLGKKISERPYKLPDPEILSVSANSRRIAPASNADITGAISPIGGGIPSPKSSPAPNSRSLSVFNGRKVMLATDMNLTEHLRTIIEGLIRQGGGEITNNVDEATTYVCLYRSGEDYQIASWKGKEVGNLSWLYYLITHNTWTSPMRRLMHYPIPTKPIPGFESYIISLSNYTGEARIYLESLVKAAGAQFTKTMKSDNTHLITAHKGSEKCDAAKEWNINIVNHLWLEESYAKYEMQSLTIPRYTTFPPRTNLGEVVGKTEIDKAALERHFYKKVVEPRKVPRLSRAKITDDEDVKPASKNRGNTPIADKGKNRANTPTADKVKNMANTPTVDRVKKTRHGTPLRTPAATRLIDEKENEIPPSGGRSAKTRAMSLLHDMADDMTKYEKESKRVGGVVYGGRKASDPDRVGNDKERAKGKKRTSDAMDIDKEEHFKEPQKKAKKSRPSDAMDTDEDEKVKQPHKSAKKSRLPSGKPPILHRLMLSGYQPWVNNLKQESTDTAKLRDLGILVTNNPKDVTLLCAPKIVRTKKFVAALAAAPTLVSTSFIEHCLAENEIPDVEDHPFEDTEGEETYIFGLEESRQRALQNKGHLLRGWQIFCSENVKGGFDTYKDIIEANGGVCTLYRGKNTLKVSKRTINEPGGLAPSGDHSQNQGDDEGDVLYLLSDPDKAADKKMWPSFREVAKKADMVPRIVKTDWLLFVAMSQQMYWEPKYEIKG